jgi:uncharacterized protein YcaQ
VFPASIRRAKRIAPAEAKKALILRAARAMGVGTARDIAQYFHIDAWWDRVGVGGIRPRANTQRLFDELVEARCLEPARVEGWDRPAYVFPGARVPRSVDVCAIVSPFDPVMWERGWTRAVFGFDYQIEIYVPGHKRIHGYYVLPFLMGDRFAARVDLKADRLQSTLIVHAAYLEPGFSERRVAAALAGELRSLAAWLSLEALAVGTKGTLARALKRALRA